jgi:hypothetical protein
MGGLTLLAEARKAGLTVRAEGDKLVIRGPRSAEDLARRLLEAKAEVRAQLAWERAALAPAAAPCPRCGRRLDAKARCWPCNYRTCTGCGRDSGSAFVELCIRCGKAFNGNQGEPL